MNDEKKPWYALESGEAGTRMKNAFLKAKKASAWGYGKVRETAEESADPEKQQNPADVPNAVPSIRPGMRNMEKKTGQTLRRLLHPGQDIAGRNGGTLAGILKKSTDSSVLLLALGGVLILFIVVFLCIVAFLPSSSLGILFSPEVENTETVSDIYGQCCADFFAEATRLASDIPHDELVMQVTLGDEKELLALYAVLENVRYGNDVMTMDNTKKALLQELFASQNKLTAETTERKVRHVFYDVDEDGNKIRTVWTETITRLTIKSTNKTKNAMCRLYNLTENEKEQLCELLKDDYSGLWAHLL